MTFRLGSPVIGIAEMVGSARRAGRRHELGRSIADPARVPSTTGPIVLEMIRGPAAMVIGWYQMFSGKAVDCAGAGVEEAVEVPRQAWGSSLGLGP